MYNVTEIKKDFPVLGRKINGKPNVYLDTAASAQKPQCMIDKICHIYQHSYANVHRGTYTLAEEITQEYELARQMVQHFISAASPQEIVFTRGATEGINLVASSWGLKNLSKEDEILISEAEHHANLVPWQIVAQKTGAVLKVFKIADDGSFLPEAFEGSLTPRVKLVAITAMSNVLGTLFPIKQIVQKAHQTGATVLVDACQFAVHNKINVQDLDADFLVFSGHKTYGPTGIGVLYGKKQLLEQMPPYQAGGDMVENVTYQHTTYDVPPARFEAGTPAIVEAIGLGQSLAYMENLKLEEISAHEAELTKYMLSKADTCQGFKLIGPKQNRGGVFSFEFHHIHPQDLAFVLGKEGVAIRIGHHCAQPLVNRMGYTSVARASFGLYTSTEDIDAFFEALKKAERFF